MSEKIKLEKPQIGCYAQYITMDSSINFYKEDVSLVDVLKTEYMPEGYWWIICKDDGTHALANLDELDDFYTY